MRHRCTVLNESLDADHDDPAHLTRWLAEDRFGAVAIRGVGSHGWGDLCAACTSNEDGTEMRYVPPAAVALAPSDLRGIHENETSQTSSLGHFADASRSDHAASVDRRPSERMGVPCST